MKGVAVLGGGKKKKREEKQHNEKEEHTHMEKNGQRQSRLIANAVQMLSMTKNKLLINQKRNFKVLIPVYT